MVKKYSQGILLFMLMIAFPLVSIYFLRAGNNYRKDQFKKLESKGVVADFSFIDQKGTIYNQDSIKGKIVISDFFFTRCPGPCYEMAQNLLRVQKAFRDRNDIVILSHTVDPKHDSVAILKQYAEKIGATPYKWYFLTGEKEALYKQAKLGYKLPAGEGDNHADFFHSQYVALIDTSLNIRNYYDATDAQKVNEMITHISMIMPDDPKSRLQYKRETEK